MGDRHIFAQTAHIHFLIRVYSMDDATGTEEQASLEHGVGEQMIHSSHISKSVNIGIFLSHRNLAEFGVWHTNTKCNEHEADLRNR